MRAGFYWDATRDHVFTSFFYWKISTCFYYVKFAEILCEVSTIQLHIIACFNHYHSHLFIRHFCSHLNKFIT